jgi:uncharacterized protein (TIGR02391 family)
MPGRRQSPDHAEMKLKEFSSFEEMDNGIAKLRRRIADVEAIDPRIVRYDHEKVRDVEESISNTILDVFGLDSPEYLAHRQFEFFRSATRTFSGDDEAQEFFAEALPQAVALLGSLVLRLEGERAKLGQGKDDRVRSAFDGLDLHPRIAAACGDLYRDKHYAEAVLGAFLALETFVQEKAGRYDASGPLLMEQVFSPDGPVLAFNALADQSDRDEQKGLMLLFQGVVFAFRNPRAPKVLADSSGEALETIALISLLAKRLERAEPRPA